MTNSKSPSRRTVVKGAAWAAPAVVVASAVPAMAASVPTDEEICADVTADDLNWGGSISDSLTIKWTPWPSTVKSSTVDGLPGTLFAGTTLVPFPSTPASIGRWKFGLHNNPKFRNAKINAYSITWGQDIVIQSVKPTPNADGSYDAGPADSSGVRKWEGEWATRPLQTKMAKDLGFELAGLIQSNVPYTASGCVKNGDGENANQHLLVSVPFTPTFYRWLSDDVPQAAVSCGETYYWNGVMSAGGLCKYYQNTRGENHITAGLPVVNPPM